MAENMQISIYHIDNRSVEEELKYKNNGNYTIEDIVNFLLSENRDYQIQKSRDNIKLDMKKFKTKIAYKPSNPKPTLWRNFFREVVDDNAAILNSKKQEESFMAFIYNENNIYVITGGFAFHQIECYLDSLFGIRILSGLINRNTKTIKGISERNVSKSIMATTKMFRINYSIMEDEDFGKIYKEIIAQLDSKVLEDKLGFNKNEIKKVQCIARSYFKIARTINIEKMYEIISKIDIILNQNIYDFNKINILNTRNKVDKIKIEELQQILVDKLYDDIVERENFNYDICDKDYQGFLMAGNYCLKYNSSIEDLECLEKEYIINAIKNIGFKEDIAIMEKSNFEKIIKNLRLISYVENVKEESTNSKFLKSISSEIENDGNKYFIIEGIWFKITENYVDELNSKLNENLVGKINATLITNKWGKKRVVSKEIKQCKLVYLTETEFMKQNFENDQDVIITHTKLIDNIEFADLIKFDEINKKVYLIHIKRGFDASVRDLSYQMIFSYNILKNVKAQSNYSKIEELYDELELNQREKIGKEEFIQKLENYNIVYVFTFDDEAKEKRKINVDIKKFESNIAKGVLLDLIKFYNAENIEFQVVQIENED